ncbi:hypothetical protein AB4851_16025 [Burkholderia sp. 22PA0099]|uniref:hypothetical protein n=1 Tax=Burkholderia sp. 22PA0099 TaxID=3237372 RepID=UPI0039C1C15B
MVRESECSGRHARATNRVNGKKLKPENERKRGKFRETKKKRKGNETGRNAGKPDAQTAAPNEKALLDSVQQRFGAGH